MRLASRVLVFPRPMDFAQASTILQTTPKRKSPEPKVSYACLPPSRSLPSAIAPLESTRLATRRGSSSKAHFGGFLEESTTCAQKLRLADKYFPTFRHPPVPIVPIWNVRISNWNADLIKLIHARMAGSRPRLDLCLKSALSRMSSPCFPAVFLSSSKLL